MNQIEQTIDYIYGLVKIIENEFYSDKSRCYDSMIEDAITLSKNVDYFIDLLIEARDDQNCIESNG